MSTAWISASDFIEDNPDRAFAKVIKAGFQLSYADECSEHERCVCVKATLSDKCIGTVKSLDSDDGAFIENIEVEEKEFMHRGVATAMCVLCAKIVGKQLGHTKLTEDGKKLWGCLVREYPDLFVIWDFI